jgi:hypothetical protein
MTSRFTRTALVVACAIATVAAWPLATAAAGDGTAAARVALVAGSNQPPSGDRLLMSRLIAAGAVVTVVDDDAVSSADLGSYDAVVVSTSIVHGSIDTRALDVERPLLTWEPFIYDDLGLVRADPTTYGETQPRTHVETITSASVASGLKANLQVSTVAAPLSYGTPAPAAEIVAHAPTRPDRAVVFSYEQGDLLADGRPAPHARITLFPSYEMAKDINPGGLVLVDAAIDWLLERTEPTGPTTTTTTPSTTTPTTTPTSSSTSTTTSTTAVANAELKVTQLVLGSNETDTFPVQLLRNGAVIGTASAASGSELTFAGLAPGAITVEGFPSVSPAFAQYECAGALRTISGRGTSFTIDALAAGERLSCRIYSSATPPI